MSTMQNPHRYVRTRDAADYLGLSVVTLEKDRVTGERGIPFARVGRAIIYDIARLDGWLAARMVTNTAQADAMENVRRSANTTSSLKQS